MSAPFNTLGEARAELTRINGGPARANYSIIRDATPSLAVANALLARGGKIDLPTGRAEQLAHANSVLSGDCDRMRVRLTAIIKERDALKIDASAAQTEATAERGKVRSLKAQVTQLTAQLEDRDDQVKSLEASLHRERSAAGRSINAEVQRVLSAQGHPQLGATPAGNGNPGGAMSLADFRALSPADRMSHARGGGKIAD
jgi:hypothetical protein